MYTFSIEPSFSLDRPPYARWERFEIEPVNFIKLLKLVVAEQFVDTRRFTMTADEYAAACCLDSLAKLDHAPDSSSQTSVDTSQLSLFDQENKEPTE